MSRQLNEKVPEGSSRAGRKRGRNDGRFVCVRRRGSLIIRPAKLKLTPEQEFSAGAVAGLVAETIMHPLDTLNTRLKLRNSKPAVNSSLFGIAKEIVHNEGFRGLFAGLTATLICAIPSSGLYFGVYEMVKRQGYTIVHEELEPAVHLFAGGVSELAASIIVVPFEVVKSRLQLGANPAKCTGGAVTQVTNYGSAISGLYTIAKTEGLKGVYAGYKPSVTADCFYSAIQFALYEAIQKEFRQMRLSRHKWISNKYIQNDSFCDLIAGALSGAFAAFVTNPIDLATNRLMVQAYNPTLAYDGAIHCIRKVYQEEGFLALWKGSSARVLSITPISPLLSLFTKR